MDLLRLVYWLEEIVIKIEDLDGHLFFDRLNLGPSGLRKEIEGYKSVVEAQSWMNIVLFSDFFSEIIGDEWNMADPAMDNFFSLVERAWSYQIRASFPSANFVIDRMCDSEYGDIGLRLLTK